MMEQLFYYVLTFGFTFFLGLLITIFVLNFILKGFLGQILQARLQSNLHDDTWFNNFLIVSMVLFLLAVVINFNSVILLDNIDAITVKVKGCTLTITGDYIKQIAVLFGSAAAYTVGAKIGYGLVAKSAVLNIPSKAGASFVGGAGSALGYNMLLDSILQVRGKLSGPPSQPGVDSVSLTIDEMTVSLPKGGLKSPIGDSFQSQLLEVIKDKAPESFQSPVLEAVKDKAQEAFNSGVSSTNSTISSASTTSSNLSESSAVAENLRHIDSFFHFHNQTNTFAPYLSNVQTSSGGKVFRSILDSLNGESLESKFANAATNVKIEPLNQLTPSSSTGFINSPLESTELILSSDKSFLVNMLNSDLLLHLIMLYFVFMLIMLYSLKLVADKGLYNSNIENKIKGLPFGKYLHKIITYLLNTWKFSNTVWLYIIMIMLLVFLAISSFALYACLITLTY